MSNEKSDKRNKALKIFRLVYFIDKECIDNHNDYDNDLTYGIIKKLFYNNTTVICNTMY